MPTNHDVTLTVWHTHPIRITRDGTTGIYTCPTCHTPNLDLCLHPNKYGLWRCWACATGGRITLPTHFPMLRPEHTTPLSRRVVEPTFSGGDTQLLAQEAARRQVSREILAYSDSYPSRLYDRPAWSLPCGRQGWSSRTLDGLDPKYFRSRGIGLYLHDGGRIPRAWRLGPPLFVIESSLDVLRWLTVARKMRFSPIAYRVASTHGVSIPPHLKTILSNHYVVWLLDNDDAGRDAMDRYKTEFPNSVVYPVPKDWPKAPGEWLDEHWNWFTGKGSIL